MDGMGVSAGVVALDTALRTALFAFMMAEADADRRGSRIVLRDADCRSVPVLDTDDEDEGTES